MYNSLTHHTSWTRLPLQFVLQLPWVTESSTCLNHGHTRRDDARQVEASVGLDDSLEVQRGLGRALRPVRNVVREQDREFLEEVHPRHDGPDIRLHRASGRPLYNGSSRSVHRPLNPANP
jgi:hypothetical protein